MFIIYGIISKIKAIKITKSFFVLKFNKCVNWIPNENVKPFDMDFLK